MATTTAGPGVCVHGHLDREQQVRGPLDLVDHHEFVEGDKVGRIRGSGPAVLRAVQGAPLGRLLARHCRARVLFPRLAGAVYQPHAGVCEASRPATAALRR